MKPLLFTRRTYYDLEQVRRYSRKKWGAQVAAAYWRDLQDGFRRFRDTPRLLKPRSELHRSFQFYRVRQHWVIVMVGDDVNVALTVLHTSMDVPARLLELEPGLRQEAKTLYRRFLDSRRS
ncbi:MAG: type II toxin-antitoxin system RelE/ParE family toxin [Verrucomicrobiota bacterium]